MTPVLDRFRLDDKVAIVTGASSGLGVACDVLVNNAGKGTAMPATHETPAQFREVIDIDLNGCYWMAQACGRVMPPGSAIINMARWVHRQPTGARARRSDG